MIGINDAPIKSQITGEKQRPLFFSSDANSVKFDSSKASVWRVNLYF